MPRGRSWPIVSAIVLLSSFSCGKERSESAALEPWPQRVLITNDDGIDSPATLALARAFAVVAETYLVAPAQNQSSGTNFAVAARTGRFEVAARDIGAAVRAWAVDGFPADCVFFALAGPMRDTPPDLVISGVNTGANLADAWVLSGTIGAARVAAHYGVPAIAVSGVDNDDPAAVEAVVRWVVEFARSDVARRIRPPEYLAVSLPLGPAADIRGIEVAERARGLRDMTAQLLSEDPGANGRQTWSFNVVRDAFPAPPNTDAAVVGEGKIAIVAMRADESDLELHRWLTLHTDLIPAW